MHQKRTKDKRRDSNDNVCFAHFLKEITWWAEGDSNSHGLLH